MSFRVMHSTVRGVGYFYRTIPFTIGLMFFYAFLKTCFDLFMNVLVGMPILISVRDGVLTAPASWMEIIGALSFSTVVFIAGGYLARVWWGKHLCFEDGGDPKAVWFLKALLLVVGIVMVCWGAVFVTAKLGMSEISVAIQVATFGLIFFGFAALLKLPFSTKAKTGSIWKELNLSIFRHAMPMCIVCLLGITIGILPVNWSISLLGQMLLGLVGETPYLTSFLDALSHSGLGLLYAALFANYLCDLDTRFSLAANVKNEDG